MPAPVTKATLPVKLSAIVHESLLQKATVTAILQQIVNVR
jgi:hypothetical protein